MVSNTMILWLVISVVALVAIIIAIISEKHRKTDINKRVKLGGLTNNHDGTFTQKYRNLDTGEIESERF